MFLGGPLDLTDDIFRSQCPYRTGARRYDGTNSDILTTTTTNNLDVGFAVCHEAKSVLRWLRERDDVCQPGLVWNVFRPANTTVRRFVIFPAGHGVCNSGTGVEVRARVFS